MSPRPLPTEWTDQGCTVRVLERTENYAFAERIRVSGRRDSYEVFRVRVRPVMPPKAKDGTFSPPDPALGLYEAYPSASAWGRDGLSIIDEEEARRAYALANEGKTLGEISTGRLHKVASIR